MQSKDKFMVTITEACELLSLKRGQMYKLIRRGIFTPSRQLQGRNLLIPMSQIIAAIEGSPKPTK